MTGFDMMLRRGILSILAVATVATAAACAPEPSAALRPAPAAYSAGTYKAIDNVGGIYVETTVGQWPGDDAVLRHTTPIHVLLRNDGDSAIAIEYRHFELADRSGRQYAARR